MLESFFWSLDLTDQIGQKKSNFSFFVIYVNIISLCSEREKSEVFLKINCKYVWMVNKLSISLHPLLKGTPPDKRNDKRSLKNLHTFFFDKQVQEI